MQSPGTILFMMFALALTVNACSDSGDSVASLPPSGGSPSSYSYSGYNAKGLLVVAGSMTLAVTDSWTVSGTWTLKCVAPGENVGPQTGSGTLTGSIQGARVMVNLNPGWADNNVFLSGSFDKDRFSGTWMWSTFVGSTAEGRFEAIKIR
ncbi:MAG: hypothetical protein NTZ35_07030 [Ignavibacteriales bacterium]|nr:hypothetical protein [Ignavibacteriales bacterium]